MATRFGKNLSTMNDPQTPGILTEHGSWLKKLEEFKDEIQVMERRLAEVAARKTDFEARQGIEHFQNQFVVQRNNIDEARHRVHAHEDAVARHVVPEQGLEGPHDGSEHDGIRSEMNGLLKVWEELSSDFNKFFQKWT
jgi:hypothetical protein